jgi:Domain of unknown function (DUF1835)
MKILHILNGDATAHSFEDTGLEGEVLVWREVLSEGPLEENISAGSFWKNRQNFIAGGFNDTADSYQQKILNNLAKLDEAYDEINLWFEFDLHCQVNLLGVMNYLKRRTDLSSPNIFLICPADYPGKENFKGMGELNSDELEYLYDNIRVQLSEIDFIIAAEVWAIYVSHDAGTLKEYLSKTEFWGSLHLLKPAMEAHLRRLEVNKDGLNYIEQKLLDIYNYGYKTKPEIHNAFWVTEKIYGMGDLEIDIYLNRLKNKSLINL